MDSRSCQNCKKEFVIESEDFVFYERMKVPAPTFCPECRMIRRMCLRNEHVLYKRRCLAPGHSEELISIYAPEKPFNVYCQKAWWSDLWDSTTYGREYDFSKPFFTQFRALLESVPLLSLSNSNAINSDYCNVADQSKDSYLASASFKIERTLYSNRVYQTRDCLDLYVGFRSELCYECVSCADAYKLFYSQYCNTCSDSYFLYDCRGSSNCVGCTNLRSKSYCIWNVQYSKEDYLRKLQEMRLNTRQGVEAAREKFNELYFKSIHRYAKIYHSVNVTGDNIENAKNCQYVFDITEGAEDSKFIHWGGIKTSDSYDAGPGIGDVAELMYEVTDSGLQSSNVAFTNVVYGSSNIRYALYCHNSKNLFGCIGLRNKENCILNKQYQKDEYEALLPKVIESMNRVPYVDAAGRIYKYGEFFPMEVGPFAYNESIAQDYFPITEEEATNKGCLWHKDEARQHNISIDAQDLPDNQTELKDVEKQVVGCLHKGTCGHGCSAAFRFVPQELRLYEQLNIPLPQLCFNCRHAMRLRKRNQMRLYSRGCACQSQSPRGSAESLYRNTAEHSHGDEPCPNEFLTTFAPDRPEIVYCEECYQNEVS